MNNPAGRLELGVGLFAGLSFLFVGGWHHEPASFTSLFLPVVLAKKPYFAITWGNLNGIGLGLDQDQSLKITSQLFRYGVKSLFLAGWAPPNTSLSVSFFFKPRVSQHCWSVLTQR